MLKKTMGIALTGLALSCLAAGTVFAAEEVDTRPRTIVTTDGEVDDIDSMIHLLIYANDIDIDGLVYSSSVWHWNGDGEHTLGEIVESNLGKEYSFDTLTEFRPQKIGWIEDILRGGYAEAWPNLVAHDSRYPTPGELVGTVAVGNYEFEGDTRNETEGSNLIMDCILDDDERTLYLQAWGGCNTIARALMSIEEQYSSADEWEELKEKINKKVVIISCGDQDMTYADYISVSWPGIEKLYCAGGYGYGTIESVPEEYSYMFKADWMMENIKFKHGSLMSAYQFFGDGLYIEGEEENLQYGIIRVMDNPEHNRGPQERYSFISEGDSPCFMYLIPVGLRGIEDENYGSWGGRPYTNGAAVEETLNDTVSNGNSIYRWIEAIQNDWATRADWCVTENYEDANHAPEVVSVTEDATVTAGSEVSLSVTAEDPDGNVVAYNWLLYGDASVYAGEENGSFDATDAETVIFTVPDDAQSGDYFNIVCEVSDDAEQALTRYAQIIITVE